MPRFCATTTLNRLHETYGSAYRVDWEMQSHPKHPDPSIQQLSSYFLGRYTHIDSKDLPVGCYLIVHTSPFTKKAFMSVYSSKEVYLWFVKKIEKEQRNGK